ncbi:MAG: hypothetical protein ABW321_26785 [Polyangiales bacterium]
MKRSMYRFVDLAIVLALGACGGDGGLPNPLDPDGGFLGGDGGILPPLPNVCGFVCPGDRVDGQRLPGIDEGNASIAGIQSVDAFFSAVLSFETAADGVSEGIQTQLDAIRADFGIEGDLAQGLKDQLKLNLVAELDIDYEPARCAVDAQASLEASAKCDATFEPGTVEIDCKGSCEAELSAEVSCDANAELYCTITAAEAHCDGECRGGCTANISGGATCEGTCHGTCNGECSSFSDKEGTICNGTCTGGCEGKCEAQLEAAAECGGTCRGECTLKQPSGGCEGGVKAECRATGDASFKCTGRCTGDFEPPKVSAECEASAKAQASVNVQCTPPRFSVDYELKASATPAFKGALTAFVDVRLPALLQAVGRGNLVADAGEGLEGAASGAFKGAVDSLRSRVRLKKLNGLKCASEQLPKAVTIVQRAAGTLSGKLQEARAISAALDL